jgi:hypothetical protein
VNDINQSLIIYYGQQCQGFFVLLLRDRDKSETGDLGFVLLLRFFPAAKRRSRAFDSPFRTNKNKMKREGEWGRLQGC